MRDIGFHFRASGSSITRSGNWATVEVWENYSVKKIPPEIFVPGLFSHFADNDLGQSMRSIAVKTTNIFKDKCSKIKLRSGIFELCSKFPAALQKPDFRHIGPLYFW
jgi:hypothetical protein